MKKDDAQGEAQPEGVPVADERAGSDMRAVSPVPPLSTPRGAAVPGAEAQPTVSVAPLPATPQARRATPTTLHDPPPRLPDLGDVLGGKYELTELLGSGGMGAVFAAKHHGTGREVAIKVLLPSERSQRWKHERLLRFVREAKAAGRIRHPNVVDVYDVVGDANPPYLVMERLHGESLWQRLRRGPLPAEEAVRVVHAAMLGVAEAHHQGVIHRDLKPDNIFLAQASGHEPPVPKVLDFGVSRIVSRDGEEAQPTTLTRTGYILGTPSYMPIEQLRGQADVDARADVYSLGVILYEALCGQRPYDARNDHDLAIRMMTEPPRPLKGHGAGVDAALEVIVMKALAREPQDRYQNVETFASALERWLARERSVEASTATPPTVEGPTAGAPVPTTRPASRPRALVLGIVVVALCVAAWLIGTRLVGSSAPAATPGAPGPASASRAKSLAHDGPPPVESAGAPAVPARAEPAPALPRTASEGRVSPPPSPARARPAPVRRRHEGMEPKPDLDPPTKLKPEDF